MTLLLDHAIRNFEPRPRVAGLHWSRDSVQGEDGRPYDHLAYPHIGAPGGPWDAFDDPRVRTIWLQWASRCGKTFFGLCCLLIHAAINPCPMMFASADQKLAVEVVARFYRMAERCKAVVRQLRPKRLRRQDRIDFDFCRCFVAWARSVSTLADKDVKLGLANEIDKWEHKGAASDSAKEADPLKLFDDRFKNIPSHKRIKDSTPTVKGRSRIERGRLQSTNCLFHVPCPHCKHYQTLRMGAKGEPGGLTWDKNAAGKSDPDLARETARYVCESCGKDILDQHRATMMRSGVWCPEGCTVDDAKALEVVQRHRAWALDDSPSDPYGRKAAVAAFRHEGHTKQQVSRKFGITMRSIDATCKGFEYQWRGWRHAEWIIGDPARDGTDAGYQLSSLYALSLGWGDIAAEFVRCKDKPQDLRNFINQWLAETWEIVARQQTWEQLGTRLIDKDLPVAIVPEWASLLTCGIDRQQEHFVYVVDAWGPGRSSATIAYGEAESIAEIRDHVLYREWHYASGGRIRPAFSLADSGYRPEGIYDFCRDCRRLGINVAPCKGSSAALNAEYRVNTLGKDTSAPGAKLVHIDTIRTQAWIERQLHSLQRSDVGGASLFNASLVEHQDFLEQLLNDAAVMDLDRANNDRENWERIDASVPNDYRDCRRYAYVAMLIATRNKPIAERIKQKAKPPADEPKRETGVKFLERPGGWIPRRG